MLIGDNFRLSRERWGILMVVSGLALAAFSGAIMKLLTDNFSPVLITWMRFLGCFLILFLIFFYRKTGLKCQPNLLLLNCLRGLLVAIGGTSFIYGVKTIDYANAISILYVYPFFMIIFSPIALKEKVGWYSWLGGFVGFSGVVFVMQPDTGNLDINAIFILISGLMVSFQMLLNRKLGKISDPFEVLFWSSLCVSVILFPFVAPVLNETFKVGFYLMIILSILTISSQSLMIIGMSRVKAGNVAPFTYIEIIVAVIIGYLMFGTFPNFIGVVGIILIISSGVFVSQTRNYLSKKNKNFNY